MKGATLWAVWASVMVCVNAMAGDRERRQASGCYWWNGECDDTHHGGSNTPAPPTPHYTPDHAPQHTSDHSTQSPDPHTSDHSTPNPDSSTSGHHHPHQEYQDFMACDNYRGVCVPYYLCKNNSIITDGAGIIDIRFGGGQQQGQPISTSECPGYLDVCCTSPLPPSTPTPPPTTPYPAQCGKRNQKGIDVRIQGFKDNQAQFAEFPWMVAILKNEVVLGESRHLYVCGGSLLHPLLVLTAAHCVANLESGQLTTRMGEWDTQRAYEPHLHQDRAVYRIVIHPEYNKGGTLYYDYALLHLSEPVQLTHNVDTVCLGQEYDHTACLVTGWGKDKFGKEGVFQNVLKKVDLPLWEDGRCETALRTTRLSRLFNLHQSFVCAGGEHGEDACSGDGGSPLVCQSAFDGRYVQTGIVAWGIGCGTPGIPGVYADVPFAYEWIIKEANLLLEGLDGYSADYWSTQATPGVVPPY